MDKQDVTQTAKALTQRKIKSGPPGTRAVTQATTMTSEQDKTIKATRQQIKQNIKQNPNHQKPTASIRAPARHF